MASGDAGDAMGMEQAMIVAGVGCRAGASAIEIEAAIAAALDRAGLANGALALIATAQAKAGEPGIAAAASARGAQLVVVAQAALEAAGQQYVGGAAATTWRCICSARVEADTAADEPADVRAALARRVTAVVHRAKRRQVDGLRDLVQPHAPVVILEIEEILGVEAAGDVDRLALDQHAAARHHRHAQHRLFAGRVDVVAQLVAVEAPAEQPTDEARSEAPHEEVEHGRIALAQKIGRAIGTGDRRRRRAHVGVRVEPAHGVGDRIARDFDVGVQHELIVGARPVQHQVMRDAVANVEVPVQVGHLDPGIGEARLPEADHLVGDDPVFAVVDQRHGDAADATVLARGADRQRELAQAALEQHRVGAERDDTDGQRRGKHGTDSEWAAGANVYCRGASGRIVEE